MNLPAYQPERNEIQLATCAYFEQGRRLVATSADFDAWVAGLLGVQQVVCQAAGFEAAKQNISFRRFLLESNGFSLYEYMEQHLSALAFEYWRRHYSGGVWGAALNPNYE